MSRISNFICKKNVLTIFNELFAIPILKERVPKIELDCSTLVTNHEASMQKIFSSLYMLCKRPQLPKNEIILVPGKRKLLEHRVKYYISVTSVILAALRNYKPRYWRYNPARCNAFHQHHETAADHCCGKYPDR